MMINNMSELGRNNKKVPFYIPILKAIIISSPLVCSQMLVLCHSEVTYTDENEYSDKSMEV